MAGIDLNRTSPGAAELLPKSISSEIWAEAAQASVIMQMGRQIALPGAGLTIPIITGDVEADWVAETDEKPVSDASFDNKSMTPYKLAVIELFSNEFRRDLPALYGELRRRLPSALGRKFDATIFNGTAPGSNFDVLTNSTAVAIDGTDTIDDLVTALTTVGVAGGNVSDWIISPQLEGTIMTARDPGTGGYAFLRDARNDSGVVGSLFGRPVRMTNAVYANPTDPAPDVLGFAGDFARNAIWGTVEGISVAMSDQVTVNKAGTQINTWQRNMFAIRAEVEVGFIVRDADHFVKLTGATTAP